MNPKNCPYLLFIVSIVLMCSSCAQFGSPLGGPQDKEPPYIIKESSEKNLQTNFSKKTFELEFNEWIQVSNPVKEVIVSPPTSYPVKVSSRGKRVKFEFSENEILKKDVTYQINFGDAIRDYTESNILKNFVFVFSTGDIIDSLSVSGTVFDALTGDPKGDLIVCLYDDLADSSLLQKPPLYFTKTDASGRYKLSNLKADTFNIYALKDDNVNYYYDLSSELVGFAESAVVLADSNLINVDIHVFDEQDKSRLVEMRQKTTGLVKGFFNPKPEVFNASLLVDNSNSYVFHELVQDTIYVWHNLIHQDSLSLSIEYDGRKDTMSFRKVKSTMLGRNLKLDASIKKSIALDRLDTCFIAFNKPIDSIFLDRIQCKDTLLEYPIRHNTIMGRTIGLKIDSLQSGKSYPLTLLPEAVKDIYGQINKDTITIELKTNKPDDYGDIVLHVKNEQDSQYVLQVLNQNKILSQSYITADTTLSFTKMPKGKYNIKLIEDLDRNNKWTGGQFLLKKMPERIKEISLQELKAGWDLELDIIIKDIFNEVGSK